MDCPVCKNLSLVMSERQGIEIDYCPSCRGVWLDRGELDKIIERSIGGAPAPAAPPQQHQQQRTPDPRYQQQHHSGHGQYPQHKKKREGFLSDIFDFD
ncbi:zf-TFIIB domain-containing protein [Duganella sp. BuS-21]|uniref:TFIIB-type zinc ribbon-containing protein n=1 Tax=Duganella sp. BuS-21 TaxID=2943848 RepID=UPI0035A744C5